MGEIGEIHILQDYINEYDLDIPAWKLENKLDQLHNYLIKRLIESNEQILNIRPKGEKLKQSEVKNND